MRWSPFIEYLWFVRVPSNHVCRTITGVMKWMRGVWRNGGVKFVASVAVTWYEESLPSNPGDPCSILGGVRNFNFYIGIGVRPLSVSHLYCLWRWHWHCSDHTFREAHHLSMCPVFWSIVCCSPYMHLTHCHLGCEYQGCKSYIVLTTYSRRPTPFLSA